MTVNYEQMNKQQLSVECYKRGIKYSTVKTAVRRGRTVEKALTEAVINKQRIQTILSTGKKVFNKDFNSVGEVSKELDKAGVRVSTGIMVSAYSRIVLYEKIVGTELEFLLVGTAAFNYKQEEYRNFAEFMFRNKLIPATLFKSLIDNIDGDLSTIVLNCSNDPLFRNKQKSIIGDTKHNNIHKLCKELKIVEQTYRKYIRLGMTHEETLAACLENKKLREVEYKWFPITINGVSYKSPSDIKKKISVSTNELKQDLLTLTREQLIDKYQTYGNYYKEFKTKADLIEHYNLDYFFFTNIVGAVRNVVEAVKIAQSLSFKYNGVTIYATKNSLPEYVNCSNTDDHKT